MYSLVCMHSCLILSMCNHPTVRLLLLFRLWIRHMDMHGIVGTRTALRPAFVLEPACADSSRQLFIGRSA